MSAYFWKRHPALLLGIAFFLGTLFALKSPWALLPLPLLLTKTNCYKVCLFFLLPLPLLYHSYTFPPSQSPVSGTFHIDAVTKNRRFSKGWIYQGRLKTALGKLHARIYTKERYPANRDYHIEGVALTQNGHYYTVKTEGEWSALPRSWSLAEWRFHAKKWVKRYIHKRIPRRRAALFLTGVSTGQLEERVMLQEFGNLGLSHIMAISGFHFALLTLFFHLLLRLFLPAKIEAITLMVLITLYLFFIGKSPSIERAWIVATLFLLGQVVERLARPLNSLGVALLLITVYDPLSATTLSFQLSFLATAGILMLHPLCDRLLRLWIPKRPLSQVIERSFFGQCRYILSALFRESFALTFSVHLALIPLLLLYFHTFSLNSLLYNLFFPFLTTLAILLFLFGIVLGSWLHHLTGWYCEALLTIPESPPILFKTHYVSPFPTILLPLYLIFLFTGALFYTHRIEQKKEEV